VREHQVHLAERLAVTVDGAGGHGCLGADRLNRGLVAKLLAGAFPTVPTVATRLGVDPTVLTEVLTRYGGGLLTAGVHHDPEALREHLATVFCGEQVPA